MGAHVKYWIVALLLCLGSLSAVAAEHLYKTGNDTCEGWPRAPIAMAQGFCAGLVVSPPAEASQRVIAFPRLLLPLGGPNWLVTDMGHWSQHDGKVVKLTAEPGRPPVITVLFSGLYMPHGLAKGPDSKIYVGEATRIFRFDPKDTSPTVEPVLTGLKRDEAHPGLHPLTFFLFDANKDLLVTEGAPSDQCLKDGKPDGDKQCSQTEGDLIAAVRRYHFAGNGRWSASYTVEAKGLRNPLAMVRHSSGTLLAGDNGMDFPPADSPFEELNVLTRGSHYGWPYCYETAKPNPAWVAVAAMDCAGKAHTGAARLLPPHGAPLSALYYDGTMFPELRGQLLISLHGYRPAGARIVAFQVDSHGVPLLAPDAHYDAYVDKTGDLVTQKPYDGPAGQPLILTPGWNEVPGRPKGSPVGLAVAEDGAIWVAENTNGTILRIARDRP